MTEFTCFKNIIHKKGESKVLEFESERKAQNLQGGQQFQNEGNAHSPRQYAKYPCDNIQKHSLIQSRAQKSFLIKYLSDTDLLSNLQY